MSWIGAKTRGQHTIFNPNGLQKTAFTGAIPRRLMPRGTIVVETLFPDQFNQPLDLIDYERWHDYRRSLHMVLGPNERLWLANEQGANLMMPSLDLSACEKDTPIRISFAWDAYQMRSWLSAEDLATGQIYSKTIKTAYAIPMDDVARVLFCKDCQSIAPAVSALFVSDQVEKLGYSSGLSSGALVDTENGPTPIEKLAHGDLIATQDSDLSPLVALIQTEVPNFGSYRGVELRQPFQNLTQTLSVSKDTHILTNGIDTEYQFGCESVSLKAEHIAPFVPRSQGHSAAVTTRYQLILENSGAFQVAGISVLSLTARHDTHNADLHARTRLSHLNANQLVPSKASRPRLLYEHEATTLLSDRYL
ncbi:MULTISPECIES: Hint domain-containing protein [Pacificibacter]|uniref:Hint domain-containing protein n=1 Tax=Pacificibacter TaxID=1042323 RepID=UPI001C08D82D|nr:Hint domain-containing protein [Pacificibacter sp. 1_MG-2023]MBU2937226.1 Hint domain-containing protein [Pacificibacter marinus]MDO6615221.1 Hint domain-containing protein [Pacificibacter sp. 1_MG-2023]